MSSDLFILHEALLDEFRRRLFAESVPRIKKCLDRIDEEELWRRPNAQSNSIGNLILHLCGNARQWICAGLGDAPDHRQRNAEFAARGGKNIAELTALLDELEADLRQTLDRIPPAALLQVHAVQGFRETGLSILIHVVEHFSYHTGQITSMVKAWKNVDMAYYEGIDLERKG